MPILTFVNRTGHFFVFFKEDYEAFDWRYGE
jgi:hypothetical protein